MMVLVLSACSEPKTENGGNADDSKTARVTLTLSKGSTAQEPAYPTRDGYIFDGWYTDDNTFLKSFKFKTPITQDITLYTKWRPVKVGKYTVSFQMNGSPTKISAQEISKNAMANQPAVPTRSGHVFDGWYTDDKFDTLFDFSPPITEHITLYAKWNVALSLAKIIDLGTIPQDLSPYNEIVQAVLAPYKNGAEIVARYVTVAGARNKDGSAWKHAKAGTDLRTTLQGINDASSGKVYLLLIGSGEYKANTAVAGNEAFLKMKNHVAIVGGWDSNRDWARTVDTHTILSGDDTRRVFVNANIDSTALLYGVEITKGKSIPSGGGMYNIASSPVLMNVTFSENTTSSNTGGGMYNGGSSPVLMNVTFSGNTAKQYGGGMYSDGSSPVLMNVTFSGNTADYGGGMFNWRSSPALTNVTFSGNTASTGGGGMFNRDNSSPVLTNVTFSGNKADYGGGMFNRESSPTIVNAVFWGNTATEMGPQIHAFKGGTITFAYSVIDRGDTADGGILLDARDKLLPTAAVTDPRYTDPSLSALTNNGGFVSTHAILNSSSAENIGLYVRRQGSTFYYSTDKITWYTGFGSDGLTGTITLPNDAIDLTATDATGHERTGRPDAGSYEAR